MEPRTMADEFAPCFRASVHAHPGLDSGCHDDHRCHRRRAAGFRTPFARAPPTARPG